MSKKGVKRILKIGADTHLAQLDLVESLARAMALVSDDRRMCANVLGGGVG